MFPEWKRISDSNYSSLIRLIMLLNGGQYTILDLPIIKIELFIPANLDSDLSSLILDIEAFDNLAESAFINYFSDQISIANMFTDFCLVVAFLVCAFCETLPAIAANGIYKLKLVQFRLLKRREFVLIAIKGLIWGET